MAINPQLIGQAFQQPGTSGRAIASGAGSWTSPQNLLTLGGLGVSALGAGLSARSAGQDRESNERLTREQIAEQRRQFDLTNTQQVQGRNSNRALMGALLPQVSNFRVSAPDVPTQGLGAIMGTSLGSYVPQISGGYMNIVPEGGIPQNIIDQLSAPLPTAANFGAGGAGGGLGSVSPEAVAAGGGSPGRALGAVSGAASGASVGSLFGPIGTGVGAGVGALIGAIQGNRNETRGQREELAERMGFPSLHDLNQALSQLGPEGNELRRIGESVIGRHDAARNAAWMQQVYTLLNGGR